MGDYIHLQRPVERSATLSADVAEADHTKCLGSPRANSHEAFFFHFHALPVEW